MVIIRRSLVLLIIFNFFYLSNIYLVQKSEEVQNLQKIKNQVTTLRNRIDGAYEKLDEFARHSNRACTVACFSAKQSDIALTKANHTLEQAEKASNIAVEAMESIEKIQVLYDKVVQAANDADLKLEEAYERIQENFNSLLEKQQEQRLQAKFAEIEEMEKRGIYSKKAKLEAEAMAGAKVEVETVRWDKIKKILISPESVIAISTITSFIYLAKYGVSYLINRLSIPKVIVETSVESNKNYLDMNLTDLIFTSILQKRLLDLVVRIKTAKMYNENLPNVLFYGAPGTGKSIFVKVLAHNSGLNYAFTSGTEFAKIKDLNIANEELRKLLKWAKNDKKGLIIFIDEAETLFSNRKLPDATKMAQDFINTFLALVPEKSNKKLMFIFATNYPFKLDDAIMDRIGPKVEFVLPEANERSMIISFYLQRFANENIDAKVDIHSEVKEKLSTYAQKLAGFSPRAIKFIAEEMIINARRQECRLLTHEIAQAVLNEEIKNLQQENLWKIELNKWIAARHVSCN
ncbi:AAA family ATPase [Candidatus Dependentiae bacterium]|nr:AAA family ATPase [Candidatus Dependentiae bacterium]